MLWYTTSCIEQLVSTIALGKPRTFHVRIFIFLTFLSLAHDGTTKGFLCHVEKAQFTTIGNHVAIQLQIVTLWIAPHQPCLPIIINQYCWVNMIPTAILEQGLSDGIAERSCWCVTHCYTNSHTIGNLGVSTDVPIELSISFYTLRSPGSVVSP